MKKLGLFVLLVCFGKMGFTQELLFEVSVNTPQLTTTDPKVFETMEASLLDFLNNQKWTNDVFEPEERIACNMQLTIKEELSDTRFKADLAIQAVRPVYGSNYETALFTHVDKDVTFDYEPFQPIIFSRNVFNDHLSSITSFYVYIILGLDYDSFSPFGGDPYLQVAQDILNAVPQNKAAESPGWRALDGNRNRYWIIENLTSPGFRNYRKGIYSYHREALDIMHSDATTGKVILSQVLEDVGKVNKNYPNSMAIRIFVATKAEELVEIFKEGSPAQKNTARDVLSKIDASNASKYRRTFGR